MEPSSNQLNPSGGAGPPSESAPPPASFVPGRESPRPIIHFSTSISTPAVSDSPTHTSPTTANSPESELNPKATIKTMPPKGRKKGMAAKTAPKRKSVGSTRGGAKSRSKSKKSAASKPSGKDEVDDNDNDDNDKSAGTNRRAAITPGEDATMTDAWDSSDDNEDNGPYCICRGPDDHRWMIGCESCDDWFHGECIGLSKEVGEMLVEKFVCPNCTNLKKKVQTIYKKLCSFKGCNKPCRLYNVSKVKKTASKEQLGSVFCSDDHRDAFWEKFIAAMPKHKDNAFQDEFTQHEFMALLMGSRDGLDQAFPFVKDPFDPSRLPSPTLNPEDEETLAQSAAKRLEMGEEIILAKKMIQLLDLCTARRSAAIAAGHLEKDMCGYDVRLDFIDEPETFRIYSQSPAGDKIFKSGTAATAAATTTLGPPEPLPEDLAESILGYHRFDFPAEGEEGSGGGLYGTDEMTGGMCEKKRCKPHAGWAALLARNVRYNIKYLADRAAAKLEGEQEIRDNAAVRQLRRSHEKTGVVVLPGENIWKERPPGGMMIGIGGRTLEDSLGALKVS